MDSPVEISLYKIQTTHDGEKTYKPAEPGLEAQNDPIRVS